MTADLCPLCKQPICAAADPDLQAGIAQGREVRSPLDELSMSEKLEALRYQLLEGNPQVAAGNLGSALALVRVLVKLPLLNKVTQGLPAIEDGQAWTELLTLVIGVLGGLVGPLDYDEARTVGLSLLEGVILPGEPGQ